jgi:hypothetical protein
MSASRERGVFALGIGVLLVVFIAPHRSVRSTSDGAGRTQTVSRATLGLGFSPWFEWTEHEETVNRADVVAHKKVGTGQVIWLSWSWVLVIVAVGWFWVRNRRRADARRPHEHREPATPTA